MKKWVLCFMVCALCFGCGKTDTQEIFSDNPPYTMNKMMASYVKMDSYVPYTERFGQNLYDQLEDCGYDYIFDEDLTLFLSDSDKQEIMDHNSILLEEVKSYYQDNVNSSFQCDINDKFDSIVFSMDVYQFLTIEDMHEMSEAELFSQLGELGVLYDLISLVQMNSILMGNVDGYIQIELINGTNQNHVTKLIYPAMDFTVTSDDWTLSETMDHTTSSVLENGYETKGEFIKEADGMVYFEVLSSDCFEKGYTLYFDKEEIYVPMMKEGTQFTMYTESSGYVVTDYENPTIDSSNPLLISDVVYFKVD